MKYNDSIFSQVIHTLFEDSFICEQSNEDGYKYLSEASRYDEVDVYLRRIGYQLRKTRDMRTFICAYANSVDPIAQRNIRHCFKETISDFEPLVRWMNLVSLCSDDQFPLTAGDNLFKSKLLRGIEDAPSHLEELARISKSIFIGSSSIKSDGQLNAVLNKLVSYKYLIEIGKNGAQFRATGKWSMLYDLLEFIEANSIEEETVEIEQLRLN